MIVILIVVAVIASLALGQRQFYVFFDKDREGLGLMDDNNPSIVTNFAIPQLMRSHLRGMNTLEQTRIKNLVTDAKNIICQDIITERLKYIHESTTNAAKRGASFSNSTMCNSHDIDKVSNRLFELFTGGGMFVVLNKKEVDTMIQETTLDILMTADQRVEGKLRQCFPDCVVSIQIDKRGECLKYDVVW